MDYEKAYKEAHSRAEMFRNTIYKGVAEEIFPDLREESYNEKIIKELIEMVKEDWPGRSDVVDWLEKQGDQNSSFESFWNASPADTFYIEHGKYYYCIEDYYSGGCKRATKGDVVQALRGMPMMSLNREEATKYFIPVNSIEQKLEWSDKDEEHIDSLLKRLDGLCRNKFERTRFAISEDRNWLKSLRPQSHWKPSEKQMEHLYYAIKDYKKSGYITNTLEGLYDELKKL